jgi:serine protease AprX
MDLTVRFVPRTESQTRRRDYFGRARSAGIETLAPARSSASSAMLQLSEHGVRAQRTARDRLETSLSVKDIEKRFDVSIAERNIPKDYRLADGKKQYLAPTSELTVPDDLKDKIEFAYVPRPIQYHAGPPSFIAPQQPVYHLSLDDVRMALGASRCHRRGWTGKGIKVAMADSGFFVHPYFERNGYSLIPTASPGSGDPSIDLVGHGTGEAANIFAMAPDCTVYGVKEGTNAAGTLETCIGLKPHIMTNSWGWDIDTQTKTQLKATDANFYNEMVDIETLLLEAVEAGITVCFSAGNGHHSFPASIKEMIAVGGASLHADGTTIEASNYASSFASKLYAGRKVPDFCGIVGRSSSKTPLAGHIMLPVPPGCELDGENFSPAKKGAGWGIFSGTSAASPQAAGIAALVLGIDKSLSPSQVRSVLQNSATDVATGKSAMGTLAKTGKDDATGSGLINAFKACEAVATKPEHRRCCRRSASQTR